MLRKSLSKEATVELREEKEAFMQSYEGRVFQTKRTVSTKTLKGTNVPCPRRKIEGILKV